MIGVMIFALVVVQPASIEKQDEPPETNDIIIEAGIPVEYVFDQSLDLQMPQLPTGCEATAMSTLLRMNGLMYTKFEIADAMPKSEWDFVTCFRGDPYSPYGWACMAPCATNTVNSLLGDGVFCAEDMTGTELDELPIPCAVWVTIDLSVPQYLSEQDGYLMTRTNHCMVLTEIDGSYVKVVDPLKGVTEYPLDTFESVYNTLGKQAVYIKEL